MFDSESSEAWELGVEVNSHSKLKVIVWMTHTFKVLSNTVLLTNQTSSHPTTKTKVRQGWATRNGPQQTGFSRSAK